jgi:general secretion pathway protein G
MNETTGNEVTTRRGRRRRRSLGMTLIEIRVVITILGLIAAAVGVAVIPKLGEAKVDRARLDTANGLRALVETNNLEKIPTDPWDKEYVYMNEGGKPVIMSYGRDGSPGGEGEDADVSSKEAPKTE